MSVSIRLNRKGTKDRPYYKIVAVDSRKRRDGRYIEQLGTYDPLKEGTNFTIDLALADKWLAVGAKPSETVNSMIRKARTAASGSPSEGKFALMEMEVRPVLRHDEVLAQVPPHIGATG